MLRCSHVSLALDGFLGVLRFAGQTGSFSWHCQGFRYPRQVHRMKDSGYHPPSLGLLSMHASTVLPRYRLVVLVLKWSVFKENRASGFFEISRQSSLLLFDRQPFKPHERKRQENRRLAPLVRQESQDSHLVAPLFSQEGVLAWASEYVRVCVMCPSGLSAARYFTSTDHAHCLSILQRMTHPMTQECRSHDMTQQWRWGVNILRTSHNQPHN
ncbi:MAG: hypothetical protein J3Q66DRAFT_27536 [Benniella sp.]|nr:MAG: hypothetical protein J3Q66DRAFT_27536 [Benniella sp.]